MRALWYIGLLVIMLSLPIPAYSQEDLIASRIHTPGFPALLDEHYLNEILRQLSNMLRTRDPNISNALSKIANCNSIECIIGDSEAFRISNEVLTTSTGLDLNKLRSSGLNELINTIDDPSIRESIRALQESGVVDENSLKDVLSRVESSYQTGTLSSRGYAASLELLRRLAESTGDKQTLEYISREQAKLIKRLIAENSSVLSKLLEAIGSRQQQNSELNRGENSFSNTKRTYYDRTPRLYFQVPSLSIPLDLIILILLAIMLTPLLYILLSSLNIDKALKRVTRSILGKELTLSYEGRVNPVIGMYWEAVRLVEEVTSKLIKNSMTHREYYESVKEDIVNVREAFKDLTYSYEIVRYGMVEDNSIVEKASHLLKEIKNKLY
ncbi:MAG: hypothetical protein QXX39_03730 [Acidilobaceae archaeon]